MKDSLKIKYMERPEILLEKNGNLSITGISTCICPEISYDPLIHWAGTFQGKRLRIDVDLESFNCSSLKKLFQTFVAADMNNHVEAKCVHWFYHDKDQEDLGEMISTMLNSCTFHLIQKN